MAPTKKQTGQKVKCKKPTGTKVVKCTKTTNKRCSGKITIRQPVVKRKYETFISEAKGTFVIKNDTKDVDASLLNEKQKLAYDMLHRHLEKDSGDQFLMVVSGTAGTGKSFLIHSLKPLLRKYKKAFKVVSFTGRAAFLVNGTTFHTCFRMPYFYRSASPAEGIKQAIENWKKTSYLIIDEMSLIGCHMFGYVSRRLQLMLRNDQIFGGVNVILLGDNSQLRPVADVPIYKPIHEPMPNLGDLEQMGADAYKCFDKAVLLRAQMRQTGSEQQDFRDMLGRVRRGQITETDIEKLNERYVGKLTDEEIESFIGDAVVLFAEREKVDAYNEFRLKHLDTETIELPPIIANNVPKKLGEEVLRVAVNARVYLTENLWVPAGLYNGSVGTVTEIGPGEPPGAIFVKFDDYRGKRYLLRDDVPIVRFKKSVFDPVTEANYTVEQFPLRLCFATTVHMIQGQTVKRTCLGLPEENENRSSLFFRQSPSLAFVALSRVREISNLILAQPFQAALANSTRSEHFRLWNAEEERLAEIEELNIRDG